MSKKLKLLIIAILGFATACDPDEKYMYGSPPPESRSVELVEEYEVENITDNLLNVVVNEIDADGESKIKEEE